MDNLIMRWLRQPANILIFVSSVSSIVGFLFYALSSSFNHQYGEWKLWKIMLYTVLSFIICLGIFFANKWQREPYLWVKAHLVFLFLEITTVYSFFNDKLVGKPDYYSLVSSASFAIMSLAFSKQSHFGIEVDLLYFFCTLLNIQLTKVKWYLFFVGAIINYSFNMLRFYFAPVTATQQGDNVVLQTQDQHHVAIQIHQDLEESSTESVPIINFDDPEVNSDNDYYAIEEDNSQVNSDSDALPEIWDLGLQEQHSLALVNPINSPSQQESIDDDNKNSLSYYEKLKTQLNFTSVLESFMSKIRKIEDEFLTEGRSLLIRVSESNGQIPNIWVSAEDNPSINFRNLFTLPIPRSFAFAAGIRQRGPKLRNLQLKEMLAAEDNNDSGQDRYNERLLAHKEKKKFI